MTNKTMEEIPHSGQWTLDENKQQNSSLGRFNGIIVVVDHSVILKSKQKMNKNGKKERKKKKKKIK